MILKSIVKRIPSVCLALLIALALVAPMATPVLADTSTFYASTSDAVLQGYGDTYNEAWTATSGVLQTGYYLDVGQDYSGDTYYIYRSALHFDTSAIPDTATISSATLKVYGESIYDPSGYMAIQVYEGMPTYPHDPVVTSDYNKANYNTTSLASALFSSSLSLTSYSSLPLTAAGRAEINKTGDTRFILRGIQDTAGNTPNFPGGYPQWVTIYARDKGISYAPKLEVTYSVPITAPDVTTNDIQISSLESTSVRVWGYLVDDGGEACTVRFQYGLTTSYGSYTSWQSGVDADTAFSDMLTGLSRGTTYHFRAVASNSNSSDVGLDKSFLTKPTEPEGVTAIAGDTEIDLAWSQGSGADKTRIYFKTDTYPLATITTGLTNDTISCDGAEIYWDTGEAKNHSSLTNGTTYYYLLISTQTDGAATRYSAEAAYISATPVALAAPSVSTEAATGVGDTYATLNLYLTSLGGYGTTDVSFQYYKQGAAEWGQSTTPEARTIPTTYAKQVTGLDTASNYFFRAKAENTAGITYGSSSGFTTGGTAAPTIQTDVASDTTSTTATLHGTVLDSGGLTTTVSFEWGLTTSYGHSQGAGGVEGDTFWLNIENLASGTTYHFRALGSNSSGIGYGDDKTFVTSSAPLPTVQTKAASSVGAEGATLNGLLVSDGGLPSSVQFQWYVEGGTVWGNETGWQPDKYTSDTFSFVLGGLDIGKTYYFRAQVKNDGTVVNGASLSFATSFSAPAGFEATATSSTAIKLSWTRAGDQTYVYVNPNNYPASRTDGELVYSGTSEVYVHSNLEAGMTYYYRAWSWSADTFSDAYAEVIATTLAASAGEQEREDIVVPPDQPSNWFTADYTKMSNFFLYDYVNDAADSYEIPKGTFWMFLVFIAAVIAGILAYFATRQATLAVIVVVAVLGVGTWTSLLPLWFIAIYLIIGGLLVFKELRS